MILSCLYSHRNLVRFLGLNLQRNSPSRQHTITERLGCPPWPVVSLRWPCLPLILRRSLASGFRSELRSFLYGCQPRPANAYPKSYSLVSVRSGTGAIPPSHERTLVFALFRPIIRAAPRKLLKAAREQPLVRLIVGYTWIACRTTAARTETNVPAFVSRLTVNPAAQCSIIDQSVGGKTRNDLAAVVGNAFLS